MSEAPAGDAAQSQPDGVGVEGNGGGTDGFRGLTITEERYRALCKSYFNRYDADGSKSINSKAELHSLVENMGHYLRLPRLRHNPELIDTAVGKLGEGILMKDFPDWFTAEFLDGGENDSHEDLHADETLKVQCVTWNVGNAQMDHDISPFVEKGGGGLDILAFGAQECKYDVKTKGLSEVPSSVPYVTGHERSIHHWFGVIQAHLGDEYVPVDSMELMEMRLIVFCKKSLKPHINDIEAANEATGLLHIVGNKGGCIVRFSCKGTSFAFVSCHLAAHEGEKYIKARNDNCREVLEGARVGIEAMDVVPQTHHVFWMGDLNYRIDPYKFGMFPSEKGQKFPKDGTAEHREIWDHIRNMIDEGKYEELFHHDELQCELAEKRVLCGFEEGVYNFPPTFKVLKKGKMEQGDKRKGNKGLDFEPMSAEDIKTNPTMWTTQRWPAYCDRVLWHSHPSRLGDVMQTQLACCPDVMTSDHKPVKTLFDVMLRPELPQLPTQQPADAPDIWITGLSGHNGLKAMDYTGKSDPYIFFYCPEIGLNYDDENIWKTEWKEQTLTPEWADEEVPILQCMTADRERLRDAHLVFCMQDYDRVDLDDDMGFGFLRLAKYVDMEDGGDFEVHISLNGQQAGWIKGHLCFKYPSSSGERQKRKFKTAGCTCTVQ